MFLLAGCGSDATNEPSGASAGSGASGSGASSGSGGGAQSSSGTGGTAECPEVEPLTQSACSFPADKVCAYGECCPEEVSCVDGKWEVTITECQPPPCPATPPAEGSDCTCAPTTCPWESTCANGGMASIAGVCLQTGWHLEITGCPDTPCGDGGLTCKPTEVCLKKAGGPGFSYSCAASTCGNDPVTCDCAGQLCGGMPYVCTGYQGGELTCDCPTCP